MRGRRRGDAGPGTWAPRRRSGRSNRSAVVVEWDDVDRSLVQRIRYVDRRFDDVGVAILALGKRTGRVDLAVNDIVPLGHPSDVDPLAAELPRIRVAPAARDPLVRTVES